MTKNPPPPEVGALYYTKKNRKVTYEVYVVLDPIIKDNYGWRYQVVLRVWDLRKMRYQHILAKADEFEFWYFPARGAPRKGFSLQGLAEKGLGRRLAAGRRSVTKGKP